MCHGYYICIWKHPSLGKQRLDPTLIWWIESNSIWKKCLHVEVFKIPNFKTYRFWYSPFLSVCTAVIHSRLSKIKGDLDPCGVWESSIFMFQSKERMSLNGNNNMCSISFCGGVKTWELSLTGYWSGEDIVGVSKGLEGLISFACSGADVGGGLRNLI